MADKSGQMVVEALTRAATAGAGVPLHGSRTAPGLFPPTDLGRQNARRCCDEGLLRPSGGADACEITDKGLGYLLRQTSPRQVLEDFVRVLEGREAEVARLVDLAGRTQAALAALQANASAVLARLAAPEADGDLKSCMARGRQAHAGPPDLAAPLLAALTGWAQAGSPGDCPLPWLYRRLSEVAPGLTIGLFHDAVRQAHAAGRLYLHPWTGPLPDLPEPAYAVLVGHLVAYYASLRSV